MNSTWPDAPIPGAWVQVLSDQFKSPKAQVRGFPGNRYRKLRASFQLSCGLSSGHDHALVLFSESKSSTFTRHLTGRARCACTSLVSLKAAPGSVVDCRARQDEKQQKNRRTFDPRAIVDCYRGPLVEVRQFDTNGVSGSRSGR